MKNKNLPYQIAVIALIVLGFLWLKRCGPSKTVPPSPTTVTVDTTDTIKPDTGWHVPDLPEPVQPPVGDFQAEAEHFKSRYIFYKREAARRSAELAALSAMLDSLGEGCPEATALAEELAMYREQYNADAEYIKELSALAMMRNYSGIDSTDDWHHHYDITVLGKLPPGGYKYKTDFVQRTVERTVVLPSAKLRRNTLSGMVGGWVDGDVVRPVYALQYQLSGGRVSATWQAQWPAAGLVGVGWRW